LVDRIGVALGLNFPAGPQLEQLAAALGDAALPQHRIPTCSRKEGISFSGAEACAKRMIAAGTAPAEVARSIEHCIAKTLEKAIGDQQEMPIVFMGGVAGNDYIRQHLVTRLEKPQSIQRCYFADRRYSSDNAVGVALIGAASLHAFDD